jgi:hypothetical protein
VQSSHGWERARRANLPALRIFGAFIVALYTERIPLNAIIIGCNLRRHYQPALGTGHSDATHQHAIL